MTEFWVWTKKYFCNQNFFEIEIFVLEISTQEISTVEISTGLVEIFRPTKKIYDIQKCKNVTKIFVSWNLDYEPKFFFWIKKFLMIEISILEISNPEISNFSSRLFHKASKCLENPSYLQVKICEHKLPKIGISRKP